MSDLKNFTPRTENELHSLIQKNIHKLEKGMKIIKHEFRLSAKDVVDFLCVDSGSRLTIIEIKLEEDKDHLWQGLRYYNQVEKKKWQLAVVFKNIKIDPNPKPRIVLVAKNITDETRRICVHVKPDVDLFEYMVFPDSNNQKIIEFKRISFLEEQTIFEYKPVEEFGNYLTKAELRPVFEMIRQDIRKISSEIEEYTTIQYIGYKYKKKQIGWIRTKRNELEFGAHKLVDKIRVDRPFPMIIIKDKKYNENQYKTVIETMKNSLSILKQ